MEGKRQCPKCGRQVDESFQFCPFDATPLGVKCPSCGRTWDASFQFCPVDSTPLRQDAAPQPERPQPAPPPIGPAPEPPPTVAMPRPAPPPPRYEPPPPARPASLTFVEQAATPAWKSTLMRPFTFLFAFGVIAVGFAVWYLNRTSGPDLPPPTVSYALLPNEGKTKGVPVAIKVNQLTVFMIDDPMDSPEGSRAKQVVATLEETLKPLKATSEVRFAVETVGGRPAILEVTPQGPQPKTLATVTEADVTLSGETDATRLASEWAERLTDAVKVFVFAEAPTFSTGSDFGQALLAMYKAAAADRGKVTKKSLDQAYQKLTDAQRSALESPPIARHASARKG